MRPWFGTLLLGVFISAVLGNSEKVTEYNVGDDLQIIEGSAEFDSTECQQLRDRLETLESAVKSIVTALASQKNEIIAPITAILDQNEALRGILSSSPISQNVPENSTTHLGVNFNSTTITNSDETVRVDEEKQTVKQLKGAVKCSLAQLLDINVPEKGISPSGSIKASLDTNKSIEIEWSPISPECIDYNSGVWIRVFESGTSSSEETYLSIPRKCLNEQSNTTFSLVVHSPSSTKSDDEQFEESDCYFKLKNILIECRAYTIEIVPNYDSLKGRTLTTEIVIPSTNANSIDMESLISVAASSNSLNLNWKDNSGCAPQLTSFYLKTMIDGKVNAADVTNGSLKIPRTCLKRQRDENNVFSLALSTDGPCPVEWTTLDSCRKYSFEMKSEYSNTWRSAPYVWETFTSREGSSSKDKFYGLSDCPNPGDFSCFNRQRDYRYRRLNCLSLHHICDGQNHCDSGIDEQNCDSLCSNGFECGRQCISKEKICDGIYDCVDGSDEHYDCEYTKSCNELKDNKGSFSSQTIDSVDVFKQARKSIVAISVQSNHTIWLSFNEFNTTTNHSMKIYDGPYSTSPLILSHSGSTKPQSIRSSSNNLYVEFPSYYDKSYGVSVSYTSMESTGKPFIPGCGGYVNGEGVVSSPNYLTDDDIDDCFWFVEARKNDGIVCLKRNGMKDLVYNSQLPIMTVYDGWNTSGNVLYYDEFVTSNLAQTKGVVYSNSDKIMVRFTRPKVSGNNRAYWSVKTIPTVQTTTDLVGMIGTIKSPNYPASSYPNSSDYRWKIVTNPKTSIRLLFAFFETQEKFDFVSVYDGPTVNSRLLLEKSGLSTTPFTVNSSSNEMLVRFTSDETITLSGFLAVYSTV
uniref:CUB domain-containing protein n=1 Tax=Daphnia galeata TaxID=27404 RepID=A0A8J2W7A1_9CRUS|nr:unnamed protein product [Daphnia galeata]